MNLLSAVSASLVVGLLFLSARILLRSEKHALLLSAAAALTLAFSTLFWSQAVISEVYALLALFAALLLWLLLHWRLGGGDAALWLAALLLGLGLGNHLTLVFLAPATLVLLWPDRRRWFRARILIPATGLFLLGLSVYAYLPLAASHRPPINWGDPQTWKGFLWVITADQYQAFAFGLPLAEMPGRLGTWALRSGAQFGWWGLLVALTGGFWWWQRDRPFLLFSLTWMLPLSIYTFFYDTGDSHVYMIPVLMLLSLWWAGGACYLLRLVRQQVQRQVWQQLALILLLLLPFGSLALHWQEVDLNDNWLAHAYAYQALDGTPPNSLVVVRGDRPTFALWYAVYAEERRPDVSIVNGPMLAFIWYRNHVRHLYPHLVLEEPLVGSSVTTDDLVRELIVRNSGRIPIYATDPREAWKEWFDFVKEDAPIYRVELKKRWEEGG